MRARRAVIALVSPKKGVRAMLHVGVAMTKRGKFSAAAAGLIVAIGLGATALVEAASTSEDRGTPTVAPASQPTAGDRGDSSESELPSNIVTSREPESKPSAKKPPAQRQPLRRNPDYDSSGNIVLDLGATIHDMEVVENNLVVVSPIADKLFFVHIDPGGGLKGVKIGRASCRERV